MPSITRRRSLDPARRAGVEAEILAATERLLVGGTRYTELGIQRIATEAGVARSTFYVYFRDKSDLLVRLAGTLLQTAFGIVATWQIDGPDSLTDVLLRVIRFYRERAPILAAITEVAAYDAVIRDVLDAELDRFIDAGATRLRDEQRAGRTPSDLDPVTVSQVIVWGGFRVIAQHVAVNDGSGDVAVARELALSQWYGAFRRPAA